jgi:hypothetical protein
MLPHRKPGPIFRQLQEENAARLSLQDYEQLWKVMLKLNQKCRDFLSLEQGLITLKFLNGENVFGVLPTSGGKSLTFQEEQLPAGERIPVLLLTATASPWLQQETAKNLHVHIAPQNYITQRDGAERPELKISLRAAKDDSAKIRWLTKELRKGGRFYGKRGIIFSAFADGGAGLGALNATTICEGLEELGIKRIGCYHGAMSLEDRRTVQKQFQKKELRVLVATKAFGMGLDLLKLDFIIHFYPPLSLEEYWQEAGRGGRGMRVDKGEYCQCIVLHSESDYQRLQGFPNIASYEKILSTFTSVASGEFCFDAQKVKPRGNLRRVLVDLHSHKDIRKLKPLRMRRGVVERWKLRKSASRVLTRVDKLIDDVGWRARQTTRLRNNLRLRVRRKGKVIWVPHGRNWDEPNLSNYAKELNWFTEPEIEALDLIDDEWKDDVLYTRFQLLKNNLSRKDILTLRRKINTFRDDGYNKLDFVFDRFLRAKRGKAKSVLLRYLQRSKKPA